MTPLTVTQIARRYIREQLAIMGKYGSRPTLGRRRYWQLVRDVVRAFPKSKAVLTPPAPPCPACVSERGKADPKCPYCHGTGACPSSASSLVPPKAGMVVWTGQYPPNDFRVTLAVQPSEIDQMSSDIRPPAAPISGTGWLPIATAPKDGTAFRAYADVLIHADFNPWGSVEAVFDGECIIGAVWDGCHDVWRTEFIEPTHWMPLPPPPDGVGVRRGSDGDKGDAMMDWRGKCSNCGGLHDPDRHCQSVEPDQLVVDLRHGSRRARGGAIMNYEQTCDELTLRIVALGGCILDITDAWKLFKVPGFACGDLQPTMAQADRALAKAQAILRARKAAGVERLTEELDRTRAASPEGKS